MYDIFYKYLLLNHKVAVPGVGNFLVEDIPAKMDFVNQTITAPNQQFKFENANAVVDKSFFFYLSKELKVNEGDAAQRFNEFAQNVKEGALNGGVVLPGLGTLKRSYDEQIYFVPETNYETLLTNIKLTNSIVADANLVDLYDPGDTRMITQGDAAPAEKKITTREKEDYWWVYAIVLALMGLGALLYYYI